MAATATFHFASQAPGLKYLIAPSASVTATGDSLTGIGSSSWAIVGTANSDIADWVLSSAGLHSVVVTAPAGTNKAAILQRTVTSGRDTLVTTAKLYSGTEAPCTNETFESDSEFGWGPLVGGGSAGTPYASTPAAVAAAGSAGASSDYARGDHVHPHGAVSTATNSALCVRDGSAGCAFSTVTATTLSSNQVAMVCQPAARSTAGVGYGLTVAGGVANGSNVGGITTVGADNGGTPGTDLAGSVDFQLGTLVSNVSAKTRWMAGAGVLAEANQFAASLFRISSPIGIELYSTNAAGTYLTNTVGAVTIAGGSQVLVSGPNWVRLTGQIVDDNHTTPAQWVANTNNFALVTGKSRYRVSTDASRDLTGIATPTFGGEVIRLFNIGAFDIVLKHESASSTATNRFTLPGAADVTLGPGHCCSLWYSTTTTRWVLESRT